MTIKFDLRKGLIILAIYSFVTLCLFMAADHLRRLEVGYNTQNVYTNIDK